MLWDCDKIQGYNKTNIFCASRKPFSRFGVCPGDIGGPAVDMTPGIYILQKIRNYAKIKIVEKKITKLNWDSQQGRARTTSILLVAFWNFNKLQVLKYPRNCRLHNTLIPWSLKNPVSPNVDSFAKIFLILYPPFENPKTPKPRLKISL